MTDTATPTPPTSNAKSAKSGKALVSTTSDSAREMVRRTSAGIEANPLSVLVGGVALGVLAGAFLPRSEREEKLLGPVGKRLTDTAKGAVDAAKETVKSEFDVLGLTRTAARSQASKLLEGLLGAITAAGTAALSASREKANADTPPKKD